MNTDSPHYAGFGARLGSILLDILLVLLTNRKRRALHDFVAGTVVVHTSPKVTPPPVADPAVSV